MPEGTTEEELAQAKETVRRMGGWWEIPPLAHNDAVEHLGHCPCPCHQRRGECSCRERTSPELTGHLRRHADRRLQRRLATGRARPEEYLRHAPHLLPGYRH